MISPFRTAHNITFYLERSKLISGLRRNYVLAEGISEFLHEEMHNGQVNYNGAPVGALLSKGLTKVQLQCVRS